MTELYEQVDPELLPDLQALLADTGPEGLYSLDLASRRRYLAAGSQSPPANGGIAGCDSRTIAVRSGDETIRVRLHSRDESTDRRRPLIVHMHPGGYSLGSLEADDPAAAELALTSGALVASVDYRLAPEHPFPAALEDCYATLEHLVEEAVTHRIDPRRVVVHGASAGGGLAAALVLRALAAAGPEIAYAMLLAPMLDDRHVTPSSLTVRGLGVWDHAINVESWRWYLGPLAAGPGAEVPALAAPARAARLDGFPPTFLDVGDLDLFRDEVIAFEQRLTAAGVMTELHVYGGAFHGFEVFAPDATISRHARSVRARALQAVLDEAGPHARAVRAPSGRGRRRT